MRVIDAIKKLNACPNIKTDFLIYACLIGIVEFVSIYFTKTKPTSFPPNYIILLITSLIIAFFTASYTITTLRYYILGKEDFLPVWTKDFKTMVTIGFKYAVGMFLYLLIFCILAIICGIFFAIKSKFLFIFSSLIIAILGIIWVYFSVAIRLYYCTKLKITSVFDFKQIIKIIKANKFNYFKVFLVAILLSIPASILVNLAKINMFALILLIPYASYVAILIMVLYGAYFREIVEAEKVSISEN